MTGAIARRRPLTTPFGSLNANVVGTLMKEAVRRAMLAIRAHRFTFEVTQKVSLPDGVPDFVTSADQSAQAVFTKLLGEWFPDYGIVAEEGNLRVDCGRTDRDLWFTVDPLDGTQAFMRRQSHGIGTMIALVDGDTVIGACVGDVMTQEVYTARPLGGEVYRISEFGMAEALAIDTTRTLARQWLMLRDGLEHHSPLVQRMISGPRPLMRSYLTTGGSIGLASARLWKGEIGAAVLGPIARANPWDVAPVIAMGQRLGFVFLSLLPDGTVAPWDARIRKDFLAVPHELLIVHRANRAELDAWLAAG